MFYSSSFESKWKNSEQSILKKSFHQLQIIFLAQYLLKNYGRDTRVTELVDKTDIWLMPSLNPDGFEKASEGNCYQVNYSIGQYYNVQIGTLSDKDRLSLKKCYFVCRCYSI